MGRVGRSSERRLAVLCIARRSRRGWSVLIGSSRYFSFSTRDLQETEGDKRGRKQGEGSEKGPTCAPGLTH